MSETCPTCGLGSPAGMRFCGHCGGALAADPRPVGEEAAQRRHLTVMFCDLVGSTPLAEALDPEDLRDVILSYQDVCARSIERYDGVLAKYIGDGVLAYFGYPRAHEDDAQRAVRSGLAILEGLGALNADLEARFAVALHVRIGMHTGLVVAGEMGAGSTREELAIVGETPNIAARIEAVADTDTVAISDTTRALVEGYFDTRPLRDRTLKGVSRNIGVHTVIGTTDAQDRLDAAASRVRPMVGRRDELEQLERAWSRAASGRGGVVHICGEAGIGKSRLVRALCDHAADAPFTLRTLRCSPYHGNTALYPVVDHLERAIAQANAARGQDPIELLRELVGRSGVDPDDVVDVLANLLSIAPRLPSPTRAPLDTRAHTLRVLEALLLGDDERRPVLLVVEDLHWADATTVDLLHRIARRIADASALCVFTFRRDARPPWSGDADVIELQLAPLDASDVTSMVATSGADIDPSIIERVIDAADGIPLFVEEVLKMVRSDPDDADAGAGSTDVPLTLRGLLTERLDQLPDLRELIDVASVIGRDISRDVLREMGATTDLDAALDALETSDILRPVDIERSRYEFAHALLQETAYDSILRKHRQGLHRRVADVIVDRFAGLASREPEVIARHRRRGGDAAGSVPYWRQAGELALQRAAFVEAAGHFRSALDAIEDGERRPDDVERADLLTHLAAALQAGRGYAAPGVADAYTLARAAYGTRRHADRLVPVIRGQWLCHMLRAEYPIALDLAVEMLDLAAHRGRDDHLAEGHLLRGMVEMYRGGLEDARRDLERAVAHYSEPSDGDLVHEAQGDTGVMALAYLAPVLHNLGYVADALERSDDSLELAARVGGPVTRAQAWGMRTLLLLGRGDRDVASWAERTHAHSAERSITYWRTLSELTLGWLMGRRGELAAGIEQMQRALQDYLGSGSRLGLAWFRSLIADLYARAGAHRRALDELTSAEEFVAATGEHYNECRLLLAKGRVLVDQATADPEAGTAAFVEALACARRQRARLLELRAATALVDHQSQIGEAPTELRTVQELCDWFGDEERIFEVAAARAVLARLQAHR